MARFVIAYLVFAGSCIAGDIVTADVARFWAAFDRLPAEATVEQAAAILQRDYLDPGSPGLDAFRKARFKDATTLARRVLAARAYYAAVRPNTVETVSSVEVREAIQAVFLRLEALSGKPVDADVYWVIGWLSTGGINAKPGLIIGLEMFGRDERTPVDELSDWARANTQSPEIVPHIVAHELIHRYQRRRGKRTLLSQALAEGAADYLGEWVSGGHINARAHAYGTTRFEALWQEFRQQMGSQDLGVWMYRQPRDGRPSDLGYFIGYEICKRYVERADDRDKALREVLVMRNPERILRGSGLAPG